MPNCTLFALPYQAEPAYYFERVSQAPGAVLLDSGRPLTQRGRYDLISAWPVQSLQPALDESAGDFTQRLRAALTDLGHAELPPHVELPFAGGLIGYLGYDFGRRLERLPEHAKDDLGLADACIGLYHWALISDHQLGSSQLVFHPQLEEEERQRLIQLFQQPATPAQSSFQLSEDFKADLSAVSYQQKVEQIQAYIQAGDCYQVNLAQRFQARYNGNPWHAYRHLRQACPTPFSAYLSLPDEGAIVSLSPERFLHLADGHVETRPIKGTRPRGTSPEHDQQLADELQASAKDRAENLMIVDLLRNDLGRSCSAGSVQVPQLFSLESYPNVHHLVSSVTGQLATDKDALDLLTGCFPGGSITGAPKIRAMQVIDELEPTRRAIYCGSVLYLDVRGHMDSSITIRSLLLDEGMASCWGGGGIVADSHWETEYHESITKVRLLLNSLEAMA